MRPRSDSSYAGGPVNWRIIRSLLPYLQEFRGRVFLAMLCLLLAKLAGVAVPWALKLIVEHFENAADALVLVPVALLIGYGLLRFATVGAWAFLGIKALGLPSGPALLSLVGFYFVSTLVEPLFLNG